MHFYSFFRYASLFFIAAVENDSNELLILELIQRFVETLDRNYGNVCELDLIFNFNQAYWILDEMICGDGQIQEIGIRAILNTIPDESSNGKPFNL